MQVGQKVVCINDTFDPLIASLYVTLPKKWVTYVIRDVILGINAKGEPGEVCIYLLGMHNPKSNTPPFPERGFNAERFRPLDEVETSSSVTEYETA